MTPMLTAVVESEPAGGAAPLEVALGTGVSAVVIGSLLVLGLLHQAGRTSVLDRAGAAAGKLLGLPGRVALPGAIAMVAFLLAGNGFVWDVSLHVTQGRDSGPFGTPAHYLMLLGIYGFVAAGWLAVCMPRGECKPGWVRVARWHAPPAAVVMLVAAVFSMAGFPLDDLWHVLFGQDVTLWGPTHLMMICGGIFHFFALAVLVNGALAERRAEVRAGLPARPRARPRLMPSRGLIAGTVALTGLTVAFQQEFGYGFQQFRLLFHPALIVLSAASVLVAARIAMGRGGALVTALGGCVVLGLLTLTVGPVLGDATHHFPLYLAEATLVETAALAGLRGYRLAVAAGVAIATLGVLAEWGWSHVWMPVAWPSHIVAEAMLRSLPIAVGAALVGAWVAAGLTREPGAAILRRRGWLVPAAGLGVCVVSLGALLPTDTSPLRAQVSVAEEQSGAKRTGVLTVRLDPPEAASDGDWLYVMGWQGGEHRRVVDHLRPVAPGVWRTRGAVPLYGTWKTLVRYHRGPVLQSVPIYLPGDSAIPAAPVAAPASFTRTFQDDGQLLQRERKRDVATWLFGAGSSIAAILVLALLAFVGWALQRQARAAAGNLPSPRSKPGLRSRPASSGRAGQPRRPSSPRA